MLEQLTQRGDGDSAEGLQFAGGLVEHAGVGLTLRFAKARQLAPTPDRRRIHPGSSGCRIYAGPGGEGSDGDPLLCGERECNLVQPGATRRVVFDLVLFVCHRDVLLL